MSNLISVPRDKLAAMAYGRMEFDEFSQYMDELQGMLAEPEAVTGSNKCGVQMVDCPECSHQWDHFFECKNRSAEQPAQVIDQWPKLEKPAKVGPGRFSAGLSTRLVVEAAQRHYEYEVTPEKETLRIAQGATSLAQRWRQAVLPPSAAVLCLMAIAAKNACGEDAAGIPLFVFVAAIKAALAERHSDHARALDAATSSDVGGPYVSDT
ncbi:MAG: hypothetical protein ACN6OP_02500 [Pseudomonadales bacterium]